MTGAIDFRWDIFFAAIFHPDRQILTGLFLTVSISIAATIIGLVLGTFLAFGRLSTNSLLNAASYAYIYVFRGTPLLVQLMIIFFGLGVINFYTWPDIHIFGLTIAGNIQAGVTALGLNEAAYMAEVIRAGILSLEKGQGEAAKSLGMTHGLTVRRIILPQAARVIIPVAGNNFNSMLKTTSLLVTISVPELYVAFTYKNGSGPWVFRPFELFLAAAVWYLLLTTIWGIVQSRLEARYGKGHVGEQRVSLFRRVFSFGRKPSRAAFLAEGDVK
ncbi:amino acid ABC transporter permease [Caballeronia sp. 15715]|uniref:amino acid ABC transporter permease n=1 Tax=Caballeronia sp. 15715 TaxID=3391030 RepID=UPI0039E61F32